MSCIRYDLVKESLDDVHSVCVNLLADIVTSHSNAQTLTALKHRTVHI